MSVTNPARRHLVSAVIVSILLPPMLFASAHTIARAQGGAANDARLYPGDYIAFCTPAASGGCVCSTESQEQALTFAEFSAVVENYVRDVGDTRYARMLDQFRRQCAPSMQTASPH
jgi:hypothetical protein